MGVDRSWAQRGLCAKDTDVPRLAWTKQKPMRVNGQVISAKKLTEMAVGVCRLCPVQWECASYAIETGSGWGRGGAGLWSTTMERLEWLAHQRDWRNLLAAAKEMNMPVDTAIGRLQASRAVTV
jgi:hypothetical protein